MSHDTQTLEPVGVRDAKNRFSEFATRVNASGLPLPVLKNGKPWVSIHPADADWQQRRERYERFRALASAIERDAGDEPGWDESVTDAELIGRERMRRYG